MAEYISRETLLKAVEKMDRLDKESTPYEYNKEGYILLIESAPTADVAEVKHGEWIGEYEETCSECGRSISEILDDGSYYSTEFNIKEFIACPYCGAKMDGGDEE